MDSIIFKTGFFFNQKTKKKLRLTSPNIELLFQIIKIFHRFNLKQHI